MGLTQNKILLILILIFTTSFSFGVATMDMDDNGNMSDCPFINTVTICPMGFFEHISIFQNHFRAIPSGSLLLTIMVLAFLLVLHHKTIPKNNLIKIGLKFFFKDKPELPIFNKLLLALSDGILQPKLYA